MNCETGVIIGFPESCALPSVATIALLRALSISDILPNENYVVNGSVVSGDGGGGVYVFVPGSLDADDGDITIRPNSLTPMQAGRWKKIDAIANGHRTLADFGVVGDGIVDDTVAMQAVAAFVNGRPGGAGIFVGRMTPKITANVTFTTPVQFTGEGAKTSAFIFYNNARFICDGNRTTQPAFGFYSLALLTDGIHTSGPLKVDYSPHTDGLLSPTFTMRDCRVEGRNGTSGFYAGIELVDCPWPTIDNVEIKGDVDRGGGALSTYGILYSGSDGSGSFRRLRCYFMEQAVKIEGSMEGVQFDDCEFVAIQKGLSFRATLGGAEPYLVISRSHINAEVSAVQFSGVNQFHIGNGCLFYGQDFRGLGGETRMIEIIPSEFVGTPNQLPVSGSISGVTLFGSDKANCHGIHIDGTTSALEEYTISNVRVEAMGFGIWLDPDANGVFVDSNVTFRNVATPVTDLGGAGLNIREPRVVQGFNVGVTNSSGQIAVTFGTTPTGDKFFAPPIVLATGGDGGAETYNVVAASVTTQGCIVQVANGTGAVGSGLTRRINFIAAGN